jgi:8-hydroxy-5-deazaflavin:NADPH oxidoreductase
MKLAIIGSGRLGSALGARLASSGHDITFASASGDSARRASEAVAGSTAVVDVASAVADADVVVLAVPFAALDQALAGAREIEGPILWSCVNALKPDASGLAAGFDTSAAEEVAARAPGMRVVAALPPAAEQIASGQMGANGRRPSVFCCSDDADAKQVVADLVRELGASPVDAGPLIAARLVEPAMMLVISLAYATSPPRNLALALLESPSDDQIDS